MRYTEKELFNMAKFAVISMSPIRYRAITNKIYPMVSSPMILSGLGGMGGSIIGAATDKDKKRGLRNMLIGAVLGGGLGYASSRGIKKYINTTLYPRYIKAFGGVDKMKII